MTGSALIVAAWSIALEIHDAFEESCFESALHADPARASDWPLGYCVEASVALRDELADRLPQSNPYYVWGAVRDPVLGRFGHAWVALGDGPLAPWLDVTARQFERVSPQVRRHLGDDPIGLVFAGDEARHVWIPETLLAPGIYSQADGVRISHWGAACVA